MSSGNSASQDASPLRTAADRRNALKSSGPRTLTGKRRVALTARRRDLLHRTVRAVAHRQEKKRGVLTCYLMTT